jgi:2-keto-4-pentenoate hydratase
MISAGDDIMAVARRLLEHRAERVALPLDGGNLSVPDMDCAYAIQEAAEAILRDEQGVRAVGYKIAGTNPATRAHLKIDAAFHGRLYDRQVSSSPARLAFLPDFFRVYEPEIALEIGETLDPATGPFNAARIEAATRAVRPAIEIIGTHLVPWTQAGAPNLAADNAAFGHWIVGAPVSDWSRLDLLDAPVTLSVNGAVVATGNGRNVDGGAFGAAAELAKTLAARGRRLAAGDFITTGSVTTPVPVAAGQAVVADFGPLGRVELAL